MIHDIAALPADDPIRQLLEQQDIKSIITVPFIENGEYTGFVGIDSVRQTKLFDEDEQQLLRVFARTIVSVRQRINAQLQLEQALEKAKESDRLKSAFLASISHELRTPLSQIMGFSELIRMLTDNDDLRDYANHIYSSGKSLLTMIEDVFALALAERSELVVRHNTVKGIELFMSCRRLLTEILGRSMKNECISLVFKPRSDLMNQTIITDVQKVEQVLSNLFSNAVKFTDTGSIEFGMTQSGDKLEFYVKDTGIGIDPDQHQQIFNIFRQLDDGHNRRYAGLGIGLSIVHKIAEVLDATVRLDSAPGLGTTFYFTVPVQFV